jgi:tetratricopeptide (TPR) repeat protein
MKAIGRAGRSAVQAVFMVLLVGHVTAQTALQGQGTGTGTSTGSAGVAAPTYQSAYALYQKARQLQLDGRENEAAKVFASSLATTEKLIAAQGPASELVSLQCWNLFRLERYGEVVSTAQKALRSYEDHRIIETLAESLYFLDRSEEALRYFTRYFEIAPTGDDRLSSAYYYVGECYMRLKRYEHADIAFTTATTMLKSMYYWWYRLGSAKEALGQYKRAYDAYASSIALYPGFQTARDAQARVKAKAGL